eukprot:jgi/Tetstr1/431928/TSEL_021417.t1
MQRDHHFHTQQEVDVIVNGKVRIPQRIKAQFRDHVDDTPMRLVERLSDDDMKIADARAWRTALKALKENLTLAKKEPRAYESIADLRDWARRHEIPPLNYVDSDAPLVDDQMVVLEFSDAVVFSITSGLLKTLRLAETGNLPPCLVTDGTHEIHCEKWVLLTLGTHSSVEYCHETYKLVHSFRPIAFCFSQEEDGAAMTLLFKAMLDAHHKKIYRSWPNGLRNPTDALMEKHLPKWLKDDTYKRNNKHISHAFGMELSTDVHFAVD